MPRLTKTEAVEIVGRMAALKFFPSEEKARQQIELILGDLCRDYCEAKALLREVLETCNEYPGPAALREMYRTKIKRGSQDEWQPTWERREPVKCAKCSDSGVIQVHTSREWLACDCESSDSEYAATLNKLAESIATRSAVMKETRVVGGRSK